MDTCCVHTGDSGHRACEGYIQSAVRVKRKYFIEEVLIISSTGGHTTAGAGAVAADAVVVVAKRENIAECGDVSLYRHWPGCCGAVVLLSDVVYNWC